MKFRYANYIILIVIQACYEHKTFLDSHLVKIFAWFILHVYF